MDAKLGGRLGTRLYARLGSLDLECPGCGEVMKLGQGRENASSWDRRTQRFNCSNCGQALALGVIAYSPPLGRATPAWDQIPRGEKGRRFSQELRSQVVSGWVEGERGEAANVVEGEGGLNSPIIANIRKGS